MDKFDPNHILVNIKKLKPYMFLDLALVRGLEAQIQGCRYGIIGIPQGKNSNLTL